MTVIVVAYHGDEWLPACLHSLSRASERRVRLVLVDNGGNSHIDQLPLDEFEHTVISTPRQLGFAEANNFALQSFAFDTDAVCFLNQDTQSEGKWLDVCVDCLAGHSEIGAVSPLVTNYDGTKWDVGFWEGARHVPQMSESVTLTGDEEWYSVPLATAACVVVRTSTLRQVGPFDPIFGSYYEDYDLCRRIIDAGYTIAVCTQGRVAHLSNSTTRTDAQRRQLMRRVMRNRAIHQIRGAGPYRGRATAKYFVSKFGRNLIRSLLRTPSSQPLGVLLGAHRDLVGVSGRILSEKRDRQEWARYLAEIGWPGVPPCSTAAASAARKEPVA